MSQIATFTPIDEQRRKLLSWSPDTFEQWKQCPDCSVLRVSKNYAFIAMKAPLSTVYEAHYDESQSFTPDTFLDKMYALKNQPPVDVGLVIDATMSSRYYHDVSDWDQWDVVYKKLVPSGEEGSPESSSGAVPSEEVVRRFLRLVQEHWSGPDKNRAIAVFDDFGFNLTGFLIVSYLVEYFRCPVEKAVSMFKGARSPGIYERQFLEALCKKYQANFASDSRVLPRPTPPLWDKAALAADPNEGDIKAPDVSKNLKRPQTDNFLMPPPPPRTMSIPVVKKRRLIYRDSLPPSITIDPLSWGRRLQRGTPEYETVKSTLHQIAPATDRFPGSYETVLAKEHVAASHTLGTLSKNYFVSWKPKGRRMLLLLLRDNVYAIDESLDITQLPPMHFPRRKNLDEVVDKTLIDGVLVTDRDPGGDVQRFLVTDILALEGDLIGQSGLDRRLQILQNEILGPRKQKGQYDYSKEPFRVRMRDQYKLARTEWILSSFLPKVPHAVEGVVFTPISAPYPVAGNDQDEPQFLYPTSSSSKTSEVSQAELIARIAKLTST